MTPDERIKEAVRLLAEAQHDLRAEFGAEVRPINDALAAAYKARGQIAEMRARLSAHDSFVHGFSVRGPRCLARKSPAVRQAIRQEIVGRIEHG